MLPTLTPMERGRRLEQQIADYFGSHGYAVRANQILTGRSGGSHEIDVLAEKSDPLTSYRVAVECKAWQNPIEKDVVSKLHYVMSDLGLNKGIVVSLAGTRSGAATAAIELGIDVWGPDELRHHLGEAIFADVSQSAAPARGAGRIAHGWPFEADPDTAHRLISAGGKGRFGMRTLENVTWFAPMWVPVHLAALTVAQPQVRRLRRGLVSVAVINVYDALTGSFYARAATLPVELELGELVAVKAIRRDTQVEGVLRKAVEARRKVRRRRRWRHDAELRALGLPLPCQSVTVDRADLVYLPVYAGLLQAGREDRLVAVNGRTGAVDARLSRALTAHLAHVRAAFAV